jgi:HD superfamily phosphodiesterase
MLEVFMSKIPHNEVNLYCAGVLSSPESRAILAKIPGDFWKMQCSRSGRWHRFGQTQLEHAISVLGRCMLLWDTVPEEMRTNRPLQKSFGLAAMFHDVGKIQDPEAHDVRSFEILRETDYTAAMLALVHMGRWKSANVCSMFAANISALRVPLPAFNYLSAILQQQDYLDAMEQFIDFHGLFMATRYSGIVT